MRAYVCVCVCVCVCALFSFIMYYFFFSLQSDPQHCDTSDQAGQAKVHDSTGPSPGGDLQSFASLHGDRVLRHQGLYQYVHTTFLLTAAATISAESFCYETCDVKLCC